MKIAADGTAICGADNGGSGGTIAAAALRDGANRVSVFGLQRAAVLGGEPKSDRRRDREAEPDEYLAELFSAPLLLGKSGGELLLGQDPAPNEDRAERDPLAQSVPVIVRVCRHQAPPLGSVSGTPAARETRLFHQKPFAAESTRIISRSAAATDMEMPHSSVLRPGQWRRKRGRCRGFVTCVLHDAVRSSIA